eukprot:TRINITY_DN16978_c0_g1_i2.p1 TRINITY_DN16978_c0_g1~~TRINITY_DN16978_c0_g1_i2.p1  ORF type:complete len:568 (-),score=130.51 TRINITY_DN16978_c0_g1_i2:168-1829(-)
MAAEDWMTTVREAPDSGLSSPSDNLDERQDFASMSRVRSSTRLIRHDSHFKLHTKKMIEAELGWAHTDSMAESWAHANRLSAAASAIQGAGVSPARRQVGHIVMHQAFQGTVAVLIALNSLWMGVETYSISCSGEASGLGWLIGEIFFTLAFLTELSMRIFAYRSYFWQDRWNVFDALLVLLSLVDNFILEFVLSSTTSLQVLLALRFARMARFVRVVRLVRVFKELWILVEGISESLTSLAWAWLLLIVTMYMGAIFVTQILGHEHADDSLMTGYFGTIPRSMFTLFKVMTMESWADIARHAAKIEPWSPVFFVFFLFSSSFALMNVAVAVIVQNTCQHAAQRKEEEKSVQEKRNMQAMMKILEVFQTADANEDGELTKEEFLSAMKKPAVVRLLHEVQIDIRQVDSLFDVLDYNSSGSLDAEEFLEGVMNARGQAQARQVLAAQCDIWKDETYFRHRIAEKLLASLRQQVPKVDGILPENRPSNPEPPDDECAAQAEAEDVDGGTRQCGPVLRTVSLGVPEVEEHANFGRCDTPPLHEDNFLPVKFAAMNC